MEESAEIRSNVGSRTARVGFRVLWKDIVEVTGAVVIQRSIKGSLEHLLMLALCDLPR